ncbi:hypothetical protein BAUCODRAFT_128698 [Baudoinia panamericana UAMH 10762]|uniref:RRM domain-containing protein n=1 Tax=Baudoinia panamericana (strain UAMH 10762) TaxID=717646 RepID=M2NLL8_BAUPA|nr:uncharacterized protein BAUCODRAFT_128698 [Baudoinia panamericana UAMH 10762]EMD00036.1 hypothetical protein BAUCODRAFT_128698 [Baudoinia panamericana UAMH 10762]
MAIYPNGRTGEGYARVQRADEARSLYIYLVGSPIEGRRVRVHLWDISCPDARFVRCNCEDGTSPHTAQGLEVTRIAGSSGWQIVPPDAPMQQPQAPYPSYSLYQSAVAPSHRTATNGSHTSPFPPGSLAQTMSDVQLSQPSPHHAANLYAQCYPTTPTYHHQPSRAAWRAHQAANSQPYSPTPYAISSTGTPINVVNGTVRTEARGVFVSGLKFGAQGKDVEALFSRAGRVVKCEMQKDASTRRPKGSATILFASAVEARQAIELFHRKTYMNMTLLVREDKERTAISPPIASQASRSSEPVIVNGSQVHMKQA